MHLDDIGGTLNKNYKYCVSEGFDLYFFIFDKVL